MGREVCYGQVIRSSAEPPNRRLGEKPKGHSSSGVTPGLWSSSVPYGASLMSMSQRGATCPGFPNALCDPICSPLPYPRLKL